MTPALATFTQTRWSLADLLPSASGPELEAAFSDLMALVAEFEKIRPQLGPNLAPADFMAFVHELEAINTLGSRLGSYAHLWFS